MLYLYAFKSNEKRRAVLVVEGPVGTTVSAFRRYGDGDWELVRSAANAFMYREQMILVDYEVPQGQVVYYRAEGIKGDIVDVTGVSPISPFDFGGDVIFDLGDPARGMRVIVEDFKEYKYGISRDVVKVWGRRDPVVVSGVREMFSGTLNLITLSLQDRARLMAILQSGSVIALSVWKPEYGLDGVVYLAVGDVTESRPSRIVSDPARRWSLDVQQVSPPAQVYREPVASLTWAEFRAEVWGQRKEHQWWEAVAL